MTDTERLDWLQGVKYAIFEPLNGNKAIAAVGLFTVESQHVRGNTVREAIDVAMMAAQERLAGTTRQQQGVRETPTSSGETPTPSPELLDRQSDP